MKKNFAVNKYCHNLQGLNNASNIGAVEILELRQQLRRRNYGICRNYLKCRNRKKNYGITAYDISRN